MTFADAVRKCLSNYATFQGRATRAEYWWFVLFQFLFSVVLIGAGATLQRMSGQGNFEQNGLSAGAMVFFGLWVLVFLAMLMPFWAVAVRRFHDRDLSGWVYLALVLAGLIPYVGFVASLVSFVITVLPTKEGANRFGLDPRNPATNVF